MAVKIVNLDGKNGLTPDCLKKEVKINSAGRTSIVAGCLLVQEVELWPLLQKNASCTSCRRRRGKGGVEVCYSVLN